MQTDHDLPARQLTFADMPDAARLWIFAASRPLTPGETDRLLARVDHFLQGWHAHGHPVAGARDWRLDQFLLIAADEEATGVSGCSIDSLFRVLQELEAEHGFTLLDSSRICYRDEAGAVWSVTRDAFRELVAAGRVDPDTHVFDNTVGQVGALRTEQWERPLRESWHAKAFRVA